MNIQESGEMYLETIYILSQQNDQVRSIDVSEYMGYSKPSVSRAISILKKSNLVITTEYGFLKLTESGLEIAKKIYERHIVVSEFLCMLGVDKNIATEDACKMEHIISDETYTAFKKYIERVGS